MSYHRVIPRDLFNEANLLKLYGHLYICLENAGPHKALFGQDDVESFDIIQRGSDGALLIENLLLTVSDNHDKGYLADHEGDAEYRLFRPLNTRAPWALYADKVGDPDFEEVAVYDEDGKLTPEFLALIGAGQADGA